MVDTSIVLTDSVIDELLDDWLERDGETFVHKKTDGRLKWEEVLERDEAYSAYILESPTQEDLIKRAYTLAKEMIVVMDPPFKVKVRISCDAHSGTDGKVVLVSTKMFDEPDLSVGEKLDAFLGTVIHEGSHLLYTDLRYLESVKHPVVKQLWNIIEDERIERICSNNKPGLANFLEKSKYYYFDLLYLDYIAPREKEGILTPFDRIMNVFLNVIRYPKYLKESEVIEFGHYLLAIKKVVIPYPVTTKDAIDAAYAVYDIIKDFYKEKASEDGVGEDSSESSSEKTESSGKGGGHTLSDEELDEKILSDAKEFCKVLDKEFSTKKELSESDVSEEVSKKGGLLGDLCEGSVEIGSADSTFFTKEYDNKSLYQESYERIRRYIPAISRIMKGHCREYKLTHKSMRSGVLDTNKLAEAYQGVPTVYIREGEVTTDNVSVCVLVDESGSMSGSKIKAARETAILINEAIGTVPNVELFIYGHSGDVRMGGGTDLYVYREKDYSPRYSLGSIRARAQNRDGIAIFEVAKRVRKQTKNPVLMFILSDGEPAAPGYFGSSAISHTKDAVLRTEKLGFSVVQICIEHSYDPSKMFRHFVIMENLGTLAIELGKVIKKATMSMAKVRVS